jgi:hypothetical protein
MNKNELHTLGTVGQDVTKRFRLSKERAKALEAIARRRNTTESEILREGLDLVQEQEERIKARLEAVEGLIGMIEGPEPKKVRWRPRY